jgi:hypothetical protein
MGVGDRYVEIERWQFEGLNWQNASQFQAVLTVNQIRFTAITH